MFNRRILSILWAVLFCQFQYSTYIITALSLQSSSAIFHSPNRLVALFKKSLFFLLEHVPLPINHFGICYTYLCLANKISYKIKIYILFWIDESSRDFFFINLNAVIGNKFVHCAVCNFFFVVHITSLGRRKERMDGKKICHANNNKSSIEINEW